MSDPDFAIQVENLSKSYLIGHRDGGQETFREMLGRRTKNLARGIRDIATGRQIVQGDSIEEFWALRDVSFEVRRGEVMGVIGRNGAGKSTLLKVLSRITEPTQGRAVIRGRVASLLEVGTGFHPELTGRENIFLNGAILGMSRAEIKARFDEIVEFAEVERFLDTPVKRYSSGMYVRLAFAVAAHLEPEILIIDEVLAVGDVQFQQKCMGKMREVSTGGRTVLFVSHNMSAVRRLCDRALLLASGQMTQIGPAESVLSSYYEQVSGVSRNQSRRKELGFQNVQTVSHEGAPTYSVDDREDSFVNFVIRCRETSKFAQVAFTFFNSEDIGLISSLSPEFPTDSRTPVLTVQVKIPGNLLKNGLYRVEGAVFDQDGVIDQEEYLTSFQMIRTSSFDQKNPEYRGLIRFDGEWLEAPTSRAKNKRISRRER